MIMHPKILLSGFLALLLLSSCTATRSAAEMKEIQDTKGFLTLTKSLYYTGSGSRHHYFDQQKWFERGWWVPGSNTDGHDAYRVRRTELEVPAKLLFERSTYQGKEDPQRVKVRIIGGPPFRVEERVPEKDRKKTRALEKGATPKHDDSPLPGTFLPALKNTPPPVPPRP